jgi:hypothetical protein
VNEDNPVDVSDKEIPTPSDTRVIRVTERAGEWVREAVENWASGDEVSWDAYLAAMPDPSQNAVTTYFAIYLSMPGVVIGTNVTTTGVLQPAALTRETVGETVRQMFENMRMGRSQQLARMEQDAASALESGRQPSASGLFLPDHVQR